MEVRYPHFYTHRKFYSIGHSTIQFLKQLNERKNERKNWESIILKDIIFSFLQMKIEKMIYQIAIKTYIA
jgi:hypothetical protein